MPRTQINFEHLLYGLALLIAVFVRFLNLGQAPLSDIEAVWALQALDLAKGLQIPAPVGAQPAYQILTALGFELFGPSNFAARFWPAVSGALLILLPALIRPQIGRGAALLAAFGMALDPGLTAVSRQANGTMLALTCSLFALGLWHNRKIIAAGILTGLALLSGPTLFPGWIGLGAGALVVWRLMRSHPPQLFHQSDETTDPSEAQKVVLRASLRNALVAATVTLLLASTLFFRHPQGLSAWFTSLVAYLDGWRTAAGTGPLTLLAALVIYQPLALTFALVESGSWILGTERLSSSHARLKVGLMIWLIVGLFITLLYPARQVSDLVWILIPIWLLAAPRIARAVFIESFNVISFLQAGLIFILAALFWMTLISTNQLSATENVTPGLLRALLLFGILSLGVLTTILVALGWNVETGRVGAVWGLCAAMSVYLTAGLWSVTQLHQGEVLDLWSTPPGIGQTGLIEETLTDLSNWNIGMPGQLEIRSVIDAPSLRWSLRNYPGASFGVPLTPTDRPQVVITALDENEPAWSAAYLGQDFVWKTWPAWSGAVPPDIVNWITFRSAPVSPEKLILWARSDLMPGGKYEPSQSFEMDAP